MKDLENFIQELKSRFHRKHSQGPDLELQVKSTGQAEAYSFEYIGGRASISAQSPRAAVCALSLLDAAVSSSHVAEYTGEHVPAVPFRPLWIRGLRCQSYATKPGLLENVSKRVLSLGYNGILLDVSQDDIADLGGVLERFKSFGIYRAIKLEDTPAADKKSLLRSVMDQHSSSIDFLFWEATIYRDSGEAAGRKLLSIDLAMEEAAELEAFLQGKCRLIYSIPTPSLREAEKQSSWIPRFCNEVSKGTVTAFSSVAGSPTADYQPPHPLWGALRSTSTAFHANLLPLVNSGLVGQGEGLWPLLTLDLSRRYLGRCRAPAFFGALGMTNCLPDEKSLLSCNLWVASHTLWGNGPADLLAETWLRAFRPEFTKASNLLESFEEIRTIGKSVGFMKSCVDLGSLGDVPKEECRSLSDSLLARLRGLQTHLANQPDHRSDQPGIKDYFQFFSRDAKRTILRFNQKFQMPIAGVLEGDDLNLGFWTSVSDPNTQGLTSSAEVTFLERPNRGEDGSLMARIYDEAMDLPGH